MVVALFVIAAGYAIHKLLTATEFNRKILDRMSATQYIVLQTLLIIMLALPVKIIARLVFRIKYVWVTPWFNV